MDEGQKLSRPAVNVKRRWDGGDLSAAGRSLDMSKEGSQRPPESQNAKSQPQTNDGVQLQGGTRRSRSKRLLPADMSGVRVTESSELNTAVNNAERTVRSERRRGRNRWNEDVSSDTLIEKSDNLAEKSVRSDASRVSGDNRATPVTKGGISEHRKWGESEGASSSEDGSSRNFKISKNADPSLKDGSSKDDEADHRPGAYTFTVAKASPGADVSPREERNRGYNKLSVSNSNLEKSGGDLRVYIPAGRVSSRQTAFQEKVNSNSSPRRPSLTRSNSKPLGTDSEKFRRNLEAWGGRSEVSRTHKCESIADLRTIDLSRPSERRQNFSERKLSSAKSSVSLNRSNLKADVGGLVNRWESRQTVPDDDRLSAKSSLGSSLCLSHSPTIPIVARPVAELRQQIQPKAAPATHRTVLGKAGFRDVQQQWEFQAGVPEEQQQQRQFSKARSKSPHNSSFPLTRVSASPEKMVFRSPRSEDVAMETKNGDTYSVDYRRAPLTRSKSSDYESEKMTIQTDKKLNDKCDSDISIHSDSGNISVDSDMVNMSSDNELASNRAESELANYSFDSELVDTTEFVNNNTERLGDIGDRKFVDSKDNNSEFMDNRERLSDADDRNSKHVPDATRRRRSDHDLNNSTERDAAKLQSENLTVHKKSEICHNVIKDGETNIENPCPRKESVGKKINRKFGYDSFDDDSVIQTSERELYVNSVSEEGKLNVDTGKTSRSDVRDRHSERAVTGTESVGRKISRALNDKFQDREFDDDATSVTRIENTSTHREIENRRNEAAVESKNPGTGSVGRKINRAFGNRFQDGFQNVKYDEEVEDVIKPGKAIGSTKSVREIGPRTSDRGIGSNKLDNKMTGVGKETKESTRENRNIRSKDDVEIGHGNFSTPHSETRRVSEGKVAVRSKFTDIENAREADSLSFDWVSGRNSLNHNKVDRNSLNHNKVDRNSANSDRVDRISENSNKVDRSSVNSNKVDRNSVNRNKVDRSLVNSNKVDRSSENSNKVDKSSENSNKVDRSSVNSNKNDKSSANSIKVDKSSANSNKVDRNSENSDIVDRSSVNRSNIDNGAAVNSRAEHESLSDVVDMLGDNKGANRCDRDSGPDSEVIEKVNCDTSEVGNNAVMDDLRPARREIDSTPPVIARLSKRDFLTEEKQESIPPTRKIIPKHGFKDIRNRWEVKSATETVASVQPKVYGREGNVRESMPHKDVRNRWDKHNVFDSVPSENVRLREKEDQCFEPTKLGAVTNRDKQNRWECVESTMESETDVKPELPEVDSKEIESVETSTLSESWRQKSSTKSAPPVKPKPKSRSRESSVTLSESVTLSPPAPSADCLDDLVLSDQSERRAETSSSSSDESGCDDVENDEVFADEADNEEVLPKPPKSPTPSNRPKDKQASKAVTGGHVDTTVRAKVVKIRPESRAHAKTETKHALTRSHSGTWPAKRCVTYTAKVTYTEKVVGRHGNQVPRSSQDAGRASFKKSPRKSAETSPVKTERSTRDPVTRHSTEIPGRHKAAAPGHGTSAVIGRNSSPSVKHSNRSLDIPSSGDKGLRTRLQKSTSVPDGRESRSKVVPPTSHAVAKSKFVPKSPTPDFVKTRQNLRPTKASSTEGSKPQNSEADLIARRNNRERNSPSVFERLHTTKPARKSLSVRDLREKETSNVTLRKSPSRSSLRGSFKSSKSKRLSGEGLPGKRRLSNRQTAEKLNSSQSDVSSLLNQSADNSLDVMVSGENSQVDILSVENLEDIQPVESSVNSEATVKKSDNYEEGEIRSQGLEQIARKAGDDAKCVINAEGKASEANCPPVHTTVRSSRNVTDSETSVKHEQHFADSEKNKQIGEHVANSVAPRRRMRSNFSETNCKDDPSSSETCRDITSSLNNIENSDNQNSREMRRLRRRLSSKDEHLVTNQQVCETPVQPEGRSNHPDKPGGRSRSTNGSIASTSSSVDLPRGSRSNEGQKQSQGLQQKIININFASNKDDLPQNGTEEDVNVKVEAKVAESSQSVPKVKQVAPEFIIKPRRQLADEGERAKFKASFDGSPEPKLTWEFNGKVLENGSKYKIYKKDDFHFLEIQNLAMEDVGKYTCCIRNSAGEASLSANLEVFESPKSTKSKSSPPVFETELKDVVAKEGDRNICLECRIKAAHDCEVTWYCDGLVLKSGRDFRLGFDGSWAKLHFYDLKPEFGGCYECVVKNASGAAKSSASLTVGAALPKSFPPKFTQQLRSQTLEDGERLIFHAIVTGSPEPKVTWLRNNREVTATEDVLISFDGTNAKLQIEDVLPEDSADFVCLAQNEAGEARTKATLTVMANESAAPTEVRREPPRFLRELKNIEVKDGDRVEMVVEVEGTPPLDVVWVRNNKEIPANSPDFVQTSEGKVHRLVIDEVFPEDSGNYACEIYNDFGDCDSQCKLIVQDAAEARIAPEFVVKPKTVQAEEGSPVTFSCQVKGSPAPSVEWEINGKAVVPGRRVRVSRQGEDYRLDIPHSLCGDSGRYTCVVSNTEGTISHTASLNVTPTSTDSQEPTDFRSLLKSRPGLASIGSQDSTESIQSVQSEKSDKSEVEQHDFRKVLTRPVETQQRPKFKALLQDQKTKESGEVTLECEVKGVPMPTVSWSVGGKPIKESKYFRMSYEDRIAQLLIAEAYPEDEGEYTCTAENAAGTASCSCDLYIEEAASDSDGKLNMSRSLEQSEAPKIVEFDPVNMSVKKGKSIKIRSRFSGEPQPKIMWFHNKSSVKTDNRVKIETRRDVSTLTVSDILPSDGGKYILVIENAAGSQDAVASVNVEDVPNPPAGKPHVSAVTKTTIILAWYGPAYDGGSQITSYRVEMCKRSDQIWKTLTSTCKNTSYQANNLTPNTEYLFRVSAGNKHGLSDAGQVSEPVLTTENYDPKSEPESDGVTSCPLNTSQEQDELPFEPRDVKVRTDTSFEDKYDIKEELGKGKFGNVHRCIEKSTGLSWAAKIIKCREKEKPTIRQEIKVMNSMRHPKLLMLWDAYESPKTMVLVMEYIAGGELFERIIDDEFVLTERDCVHFMRQICDGVCYMHDHNILHLDLKPENILCISPNSNQIKIIDFGLARPYHPGESTKVMLGTPEFIAPEVINYDEIGFTTDMWSLGVVCYVLLSGLSPFLGDSDPETLVNVTLGEFDFDDDAFNDISFDAKDFIEKLVIKNKEKRLTVHQCLKHKWLAQDVKRLRLKRLNTRNLKQFMARRKWQVDQMQENFRKLREDHADDSDSEFETTKRRPLTASHSKDSGIDTYKDKDSYSSMTDLSAGGGTLEFLQEMEDVEVVSGDVVLFKVCVTGRPEPTITWFKEKSEITPSRRCIMDSSDGGEHTLKIKDVTQNDAGEYKCMAVNAASEVTCGANLKVVNI